MEVPVREKPGIVGRPDLEIQPWRLFTASKPKVLLTKIHGKWYDLTEFEKRHPGGPVALGLARGRDSTIMFESHHQFANRAVLDAILAKYEIDATDSKGLKTLEEVHGVVEHEFEWPSAFGEALKFQVKEYFQGEAKRRNVSLREATKATPARWTEIAILAALYISTFSGFFRGDWRFLVLFPLTAWLVGVNTFHDATHFALTSNWRINALVPYVYPFFSSPFVWYHQHNIGHHSYPNVSDRDPDILHHYWMKREHRDVKCCRSTRISTPGVHAILVGSCSGVRIDHHGGSVDAAKQLVQRGGADDGDFWPAQDCALDRAGVDDHLHPRVAVRVSGFLGQELRFRGVPVSVLLVFVHDEHADQPSAASHFARRRLGLVQAPGSHGAGFGVGSKFCHLFSGGLNYQVIHHLFPTVNHCHLPQLQPIVARLCEKYDVAYTTARGYVHAIALHHEHSKSMGVKVEYVD